MAFQGAYSSRFMPLQPPLPRSEVFASPAPSNETPITPHAPTQLQRKQSVLLGLSLLLIAFNLRPVFGSLSVV